MPQGRKYRGTTHLYCMNAVTLGLSQVQSLLRGDRVSLLKTLLVHKTGSGSSQISFLYCLAANDSSLQHSGDYSFLHCLYIWN